MMALSQTADDDVKTVLVVEDELFVALDVQDVVEGTGCRVDGPYATIVETLDALAAGLPDCAVLDVRLRDGEVFPAADRLHAAGVPIIFHSGNATDGDLASRYPCAAICAKPSAPAILTAAIVHAVGL